MQVQTKKVYNFNMPKVKHQLVTVLKKRRNESSIADLIAGSGLPKFQVEQAVKVVMKEYRGHMKVTESGELLYYFPEGMKNREKGFFPALKRGFKKVLSVLRKVLTFLFKIWIMVMLVGYFVLFLAVLIGAVVLAVGGSLAGNKDGGSSRRRGKSGGMPFFLVIRVIELFIRILIYSGMEKAISGHHQKGRPLHQSVFAFVFGEKDDSKEFELAEKKYLISFIRNRKGVITLEEVMAIMGKEAGPAQDVVNLFLVEYEGEPDVTDNGTLIYRFPELMKSSAAVSAYVSLKNPETKELIPFNANLKKTNGWITFFNGFNLLFGGYFLYNAAFNPVSIEMVREIVLTDLTFVYKYLFLFLSQMGIADPNTFILGTFAIVPLSFSVLFYLVPFIRNLRRNRLNEKIKEENFRKKIYNYLFLNPQEADPSQVQPGAEEETPGQIVSFRQKVFDRFAALKSGDFTRTDGGKLLYNFPEFQREIHDVDTYRDNINLKDYSLGETVFDSGE